MDRAVVLKVVKDLTQFPAKDSISDTMITFNMIMVRPLPDYNKL